MYFLLTWTEQFIVSVTIKLSKDDLKSVTFSEDDVSDGVVACGALLHGAEGAALWDLLDLSLRQLKAKEGGDLKDALRQVLQDGKQTNTFWTECWPIDFLSAAGFKFLQVDF